GVTGNYARSGFPIRKSPDQCLFADFPGLIAGYNVLLRLLVPRHPPSALINLATTDDARVHCAVLKIRADPLRAPPPPGHARSDLRRLPPRRVRPPASGVTDFRDVTGGVYKARERIHRDVADSRLLATPTSWGRVADPNPN